MFEAIGWERLNTQSPSERWDGDCALSQHTLNLLRFNCSALIAVDLPGQSPLPEQNHRSPDEQELIPTG
jgi:hypothetical protein